MMRMVDTREIYAHLKGEDWKAFHKMEDASGETVLDWDELRMIQAANPDRDWIEKEGRTTILRLAAYYSTDPQYLFLKNKAERYGIEWGGMRYDDVERTPPPTPLTAEVFLDLQLWRSINYTWTLASWIMREVNDAIQEGREPDFAYPYETAYPERGVNQQRASYAVDTFEFLNSWVDALELIANLDERRIKETPEVFQEEWAKMAGKMDSSELLAHAKVVVDNMGALADPDVPE